MSNHPNHLDEPDLTGKEVGEFLILSRIGRGGMADVYLAEQRSLKRKIAFKVLHQRLATDPNYVQRFKNEAQAAAALSHPNIVQIYEVGTIDQFHYIAQEFVDGQNLKQYLARTTTIPVYFVITILRQVCAALYKARESGVIHRDIKPENIILTEEGDVKVADFGLARILRESDDQELTNVGITMGTPLYMSPEQAEGGKVDHRGDLYSLGVTAYHMLTGRVPFEKETALATAIAHKTETPMSIGLLRPDVPKELVAIVDNMMAKDADDRPQDSGSVISELIKVKVDDTPQEWSDTFNTLSPSEARALYGSQLEATQKLQKVISGRSTRAKLLIAVSILIGLTGISFWVGQLVASMNPPKEFLDPNQLAAQKLIPKLENVDEQIQYARNLSDSLYEKKIEAFRAVQKYFTIAQSDAPNALLSQHRWAEFEIGLLRLKQQDYELAKESFHLLANISPQESRTFYFHGQGGLVLVYFETEEFDKVLERQADVMTRIDEFEPELKKRLKSIYSNIEEKISEKSF